MSGNFTGIYRRFILRECRDPYNVSIRKVAFGIRVRANTDAAKERNCGARRRRISRRRRNWPGSLNAISRIAPMEIRILAVGEYVTHAGHSASTALNAQFSTWFYFTSRESNPIISTILLSRKGNRFNATQIEFRFDATRQFYFSVSELKKLFYQFKYKSFTGQQYIFTQSKCYTWAKHPRKSLLMFVLAININVSSELCLLEPKRFKTVVYEHRY